MAAARLAARARNRSTDGSAGSRCTRAAPARALKCSSSRAISNRRGWPASTRTIASDEEPSANERDVDKSKSAAATLAVRRNRSLRKRNNIDAIHNTRTRAEHKSKPGQAKRVMLPSCRSFGPAYAPEMLLGTDEHPPARDSRRGVAKFVQRVAVQDVEFVAGLHNDQFAGCRDAKQPPVHPHG